MACIISVECDTSKLFALADRIKKSNAEEALTKAIHETGDTLQKEIPGMIDKRYHGGMDWFSSAVEDTEKGFESCVIPIRGNKGGLGEVFSAGGGYGRTTINRTTKSGKQIQYERLMKKKGAKGGGSIAAHIVKEGLSELPDTLPNQGGNPPFISKGVVMTRKTNKRFPIVRVVGLAVPQMANTRAKEEIQKTAERELDKNIDKYIGQLLD